MNEASEMQTLDEIFQIKRFARYWYSWSYYWESIRFRSPRLRSMPLWGHRVPSSSS